MPEKRYTLRKSDDGTWSVIDMLIDFPVVLRNKILICLDEREAEDAVNLLNAIERIRGREEGRLPTASSPVNPFLLPIH